MPLIPPELCVEIIDHLHDDKWTLCKCGLVCMAWLWSSRSHLFSTVRLVNDNIDAALAVLSAPGSTIPPHVRALEIEDDDDSWGLLCVSNEVARLPQLSAVKKLSLSRVRWDVLTPDAKECLFTISRGLTTLTLDAVLFQTLGQAFKFISSAQSLECLSLGSMGCCWSKDKSLTKFSPPPIKHLIFKFGWDSEAPVVIDWLSHWQPIPSVRNLTLDINEAEILSVTAYIRRLGPALEHLELGCSDHYGVETQNTLCKELNLTQNTSLKTISIDNLFLYRDFPGSRTFDWIIDVLSQITSCFIERVTLVVLLETTRELVPLNLPALARLFAGGNTIFAERSTRLQFAIDGPVDTTEARAAIAECLPELDSQGRLEFGGRRIGRTRT